jgi:hypothetical protein
LSEQPPSFRIRIQCDEGGTSFYIVFNYSENYPQEMPGLIIDEYEGCLNETEAEEIASKSRGVAEENVPSPSVFAIVSSAKEWLEELLAKRKQSEDAEAAEVERIQQEADEKEEKRKQGTLVTVEAFVAWKARFDKEMAEKDRAEKERQEELRKKPTGRQLFEKDAKLAASDAAYMAEGEVAVDGSLFEGVEDTEDPGLDSGDENDEERAKIFGRFDEDD